MKLECSILGIATNSSAKLGKPAKGVVCIGKGKLKTANGQGYQLQVSTAKARNQQPLQLTPGNFNMISTHAAAGKLTIEFLQPPWRMFISGADSSRLNLFINFLRKIMNGDDPGNLDFVKEVKSTDLQAQTKLIIDNSKNYYSEYAKNFPTTLQLLSINNCNLSKLDTRWFANIKLTTLSLANNRFNSNDGGLTKLSLIRRLVNLQRLDFSSNEICTFPNDLQFPQSLIEVNLRNNRFSSIPIAVCKAKSLVFLDISENPVRALPRKPCWPRLKKLYFNGTFIAYMPAYFTLMKMEELRCRSREAPDEAFWRIENNMELRNSFEIPSLESIAAAAVRQYRQREDILPWTINMDSLEKQCSRCFKHKPSQSVILKITLRSPMVMAASVDTLGDVPILYELCYRCSRLPGTV